jgi:hypothetical protein
MPLTLILQLISGVSTAHGQLQPPDVYVQVGIVRAELELIRLEMGKPQSEGQSVLISEASPREVFFQALTLFTKANRLCYEHVRTEAPAPLTPQGVIEPAHVHGVVVAALTQLRLVKEELGITESVPTPARDDAKTPTDVIRSILLANHQLDRLLDRRYAPSDVYEQVTLAIGYTARLLASFPGATRIPPAPELERRKRPADVYDRLIGCFGRVRSIAEHSGLNIARLDRNDVVGMEIAPGDVYGMATLVVSELAHIHSQVVDTEAPVRTYYPGQKLPSHVYQRVGTLEAQLIELGKQVLAAPQWLERQPRQ